MNNVFLHLIFIFLLISKHKIKELFNSSSYISLLNFHEKQKTLQKWIDSQQIFL